MAGSLKDILASHPPRETSGSRSYNRFGFQKDWIVCKILELHATDKPYLVLCDYHEDVVVLDDELDPLSVDFYQIKTLQSNNWTLKRLTSRPKPKRGVPQPASILGKLYSCYILAPDHTKALHFVSNARFAITVEGGSDGTTLESIHCNQIAHEGLTSLKHSIAVEIGECLLPEKPSLFFEVSNLSLQDHKGHTKGKVEEFLETVLPDREHRASAAYRVLSDEVERKTIHEGSISEYSLLTGSKGIGRTAVNRLLSSFCTSNLDDYWVDVRFRLVNEGVPPMRMEAIRHGWRQYQVERMHPDNESLQQLQEEVRKACLDVLNADNSIKLTELIASVTSVVLQKAKHSLKSREYIEAMAIVEAYEHFRVSEADSKLEEEA